MSQHPPKVRSCLLSYLCDMEKPKKHRRRTLAIIDGESLSHHAHYDFSFLESEKRLDVWFFFKNKIRIPFPCIRTIMPKISFSPAMRRTRLSILSSASVMSWGGERSCIISYTLSAMPIRYGKGWCNFSESGAMWPIIYGVETIR